MSFVVGLLDPVVLALLLVVSSSRGNWTFARCGRFRRHVFPSQPQADCVIGELLHFRCLFPNPSLPLAALPL
ncbi:hypothetical protein QBC32DRAFT_353724 [Pseudoneurospora amorphoporcata]|uniref:Secreted protein n=1 Tax=Pseudoneurospora amorphoporcata TaxID=241081 RepID=A0AAN6NMM2_9PEZI|nr:hypothetical protein QBC32DRAFT_353724 [Pseudoneurospora amorphoporcata]